MRFPLKSGTRYPDNSPPGNDDPPVNTFLDTNLQPQYVYRVENTAGRCGRGRSDSLFRLDITTLAIGTADVRYLLRVKSWQTRHGIRYGSRSASPLSATAATLSCPPRMRQT